MNQCDGCQRGLPASELGMHRTETELFMCTAARYQMALEPKTSDTWHKPEKKARADVPFTCGGKA
jgi:hypothetical protein